MGQLKNMLESSGWLILNTIAGNDRYLPNLYERIEESDHIVWGVKNIKSNLELKLEFYFVSGLGERTNDLKSVFHCTETLSGNKLYFSKQNSECWKKELPDFVRLLGEG